MLGGRVVKILHSKRVVPSSKPRPYTEGREKFFLSFFFRLKIRHIFRLWKFTVLEWKEKTEISSFGGYLLSCHRKKNRTFFNSRLYSGSRTAMNICVNSRKYFGECTEHTVLPFLFIVLRTTIPFTNYKTIYLDCHGPRLFKILFSRLVIFAATSGILQY